MKYNTILCSAATAVLGLAFSISASAQTCGQPHGWTPNTAGIPTIEESTCNHETGVVSVCQGGFGAPGAAYVASINVADEGTFTEISFTGGAGYTYAAYFVPQASGCNADAACTTSASGTRTAKHANLPAGQYYMIVTGADFDSPGACGPFTATANGTLPVTLQEFTVS